MEAKEAREKKNTQVNIYLKDHKRRNKKEEEREKKVNENTVHMPAIYMMPFVIFIDLLFPYLSIFRWKNICVYIINI